MFKKMFKWTLVSAITLGAAGLFLFGDHFGSYFSTMSHSVRDSVRGKIPVDFEIRRAEKLIRAIDPEIHECKRQVANAVVELKYLHRDVASLEKATKDQRKKLKSGADLLKTNAKVSSFELCGRSYSRRRVELDLERTFEAFKNNQAILKTKRALIERQTMAVTASQAKLDAVRARKVELENTISALKVQKKHLDALAASSRRFDLDDSALSQATELLTKVKKRLDVAQKMIEDDMFFTEGVKDDGKPRRNILKEIDAHFDGPQVPKKLSPRSAVAPAVGG